MVVRGGFQVFLGDDETNGKQEKSPFSCDENASAKRTMNNNRMEMTCGDFHYKFQLFNELD